MAGWLRGVSVGEWLFVLPLCGFSLSLFCNYYVLLLPFTRVYTLRYRKIKEDYKTQYVAQLRIAYTCLVVSAQNGQVKLGCTTAQFCSVHMHCTSNAICVDISITTHVPSLLLCAASDPTVAACFLATPRHGTFMSHHACQPSKTLDYCADPDRARSVTAKLDATVASGGIVACGQRWYTKPS